MKINIVGISTICYSVFKGGLAMEEEIYKKMYLHLFNAVTDIISREEVSPEARERFLQAQQDCEEIYISAE